MFVIATDLYIKWTGIQLKFTRWIPSRPKEDVDLKDLLCLKYVLG